MLKIFVLTFMLLSFPAWCGTVNDVGKTTTQNMRNQAQGKNSVETRPMLKDAADRAYERYLESFTHPIPNQFEREPGFKNK